MKNELTLHHDGIQSEYDNGNVRTNVANVVPKISNIIGRALPRIGPYKKLDNTKQVVALIDDVMYFC